MPANGAMVEWPIRTKNPWAAASIGVGDRSDHVQQGRWPAPYGIAFSVAVSAAFWIGLGVLIAKLW